MRLLRELSRRRLRTTLTTLGITIGIWALVVFSSMANKINGFVDSGADFYVGKIIVSDASAGGVGVGLVPIDLGVANDIGAMPDVAAVDPQVQLPFEANASAGFGMPKIITGRVAGADKGRAPSAVEAALGRLLTADDEGSNVSVLGSDLARELGVSAGDRSSPVGSTSFAKRFLKPPCAGFVFVRPRACTASAPSLPVRTRTGSLCLSDNENGFRSDQPAEAQVVDRSGPFGPSRVDKLAPTIAATYVADNAETRGLSPYVGAWSGPSFARHAEFGQTIVSPGAVSGACAPSVPTMSAAGASPDPYEQS